MDVTNQFVLNLFVFIIGLIGMHIVCYKRLSNTLCLMLGWFFGCGLIVLVSICLVVIGIKITLAKVLIALFMVIVLFYFIPNKNGYFAINDVLILIKDVKYLSTLSLVIAIIVVISVGGNYVFYSTDSLRYEALSMMIDKVGVYSIPESHIDWFYKFFFCRIAPFYIFLLNFALHFNVEIYYSFNIISTLILLLSIVQLWIEKSINKKIWFPIMIIVLFWGNVMAFTNSVWMITNLLTMTYYVLGTLFLHNFIQNKEKNIFFLFGCLFLGCCPLIRMEMYVFSLLPFVYLYFYDYFPDKKNKYIGFLLYNIYSFLWFFCGYLKFLIGDFLRLGNVFWSRIGIIVLFNFICIYCMFSFSNIKSKTKIITFIFILFLMLCLVLNFKLRPLHTIILLGLLLFQNGLWWFFWYSFFIIAAIYIKEIGYKKIILINEVNFLLFVVMLYFGCWIMLYSGLVPARNINWHDSGNRIILHIYPISIFCIAGMISKLFERLPKLKRSVSNKLPI